MGNKIALPILDLFQVSLTSFLSRTVLIFSPVTATPAFECFTSLRFCFNFAFIEDHQERQKDKKHSVRRLRSINVSSYFFLL